MNFDFLFGSKKSQELPDIYGFPIIQGTFTETDLVFMFSRILTDTLERTQGIPEQYENLFWDNCLASESSEGLVTMLAKAMYHKSKLFLVYDKALNVIVKATSIQQKTIEDDYKKIGISKAGIYISFESYKKVDMIKIYSVLSYFAINSFYKSMNLSTALQLKLNNLRSSTAVNDATILQAQAVRIVEALAKGKSVALDKDDIITFASPDLTATDSAVSFIDNKLSFYLGLPSSYIKGINAKALSDTGLAESKAIERGLKAYYFSIIKPIIEQLFGIKTSFKTEDYDQITSSLEVLKTFDITSEAYISTENKQFIVNKLFGLPDDSKGDAPKVQPQLNSNGNL